LIIEKSYISKTAKRNAKLAKQRDSVTDSDKDIKQFWYWLGYYNGQESISDIYCKRTIKDDKN
jgi:hypothetical protein